MTYANDVTAYEALLHIMLHYEAFTTLLYAMGIGVLGRAEFYGCQSGMSHTGSTWLYTY